jgi:hypothetical protein
LLSEQLEDAWRLQCARYPIDRTPRLKAGGLTLGAGTLLAPATDTGEFRSIDIEGRENRLRALLCAAYGQPAGARAIDHIRRGAQRLSEGDERVAAIHFALAGLGFLKPGEQAAKRLFLADILMEAGAKPETVLRGLGHDEAGEDLRRYQADEPRVPAGSGTQSGEWTNLGLFALKSLSRVAAGWLTRASIGASGATVFLGVLLIPTNSNLRREGSVPGYPGLRYYRRADEADLHIVYQDKSGQEHQFLARRTPDGVLRDLTGKTIGRNLPDGRTAIDLAAVSAKITQESEQPRACPAPQKDRPGSDRSSRAQDYEDKVKRHVNPENPTPRGMAVKLALASAKTGEVVFDDCQHTTGDMIDAKGPGFWRLIQQSIKYKFNNSLDNRFLNQGMKQILAARNRHVRWYIEETETANYIRKLFADRDEGRERIEVVVLH